MMALVQAADTVYGPQHEGQEQGYNGTCPQGRHRQIDTPANRRSASCCSRRCAKRGIWSRSGIRTRRAPGIMSAFEEHLPRDIGSGTPSSRKVAGIGRFSGSGMQGTDCSELARIQSHPQRTLLRITPVKTRLRPPSADMPIVSVHCRCADSTVEMNASPVQPSNRPNTYFTPAV